MGQKPTRGQASEPVMIWAGPGVREVAHYAELEQWAWRRVRSLRVFYNHATLYAIANFAILLIDTSTPSVPWFYHILVGWGLFLGQHALYAYDLVPWSTLDWEHRTVKKM